MREIDIIYIDDFSTDNSVNSFKHEMKTNQRIFLYRNKKNMGNLFTKSFGAKKAKVRYIISFDSLPDYLLSIVYKEAIKNSLELKNIWCQKICS